MDALDITHMREQIGWSQEELAQAIGVTVSTVNRWENRHARPSRMAAIRLKEIALRAVAGRAEPDEDARLQLRRYLNRYERSHTPAEVEGLSLVAEGLRVLEASQQAKVPAIHLWTLVAQARTIMAQQDRKAEAPVEGLTRGLDGGTSEP